MIATIPKLVYLFVAVCTSPAGNDCQFYAMDSFEPGPAQMTDCREALGASVAELQAKGVRNVRLGCKTLEQLQREGL